MKPEKLSGTVPWSYKDESIEVALTGKAFKYIEQRKNTDPYTFKSVLAKA
jgi:hypothetical protein